MSCVSELNLHFTQAPRCELLRLEFVDDRNAHYLSVRGKYDGAFRGATTFSWTRGVKALSIFFLQSRLASEASMAASALLHGEAGSVAASLDYALARNSEWLIRFFGSDVNGNARARRLVLRSNPERKRPGPVVLRLNERKLNPERIVIFLDGRQLDSVDELCELHSLLLQSWQEERVTLVQEDTSRPSAVQPPADSDPSMHDSATWQSMLSSIVAEEAQLVLRQPRLFSRGALLERLHAVAQDELFRSLAGTASSRIAEFAEDRTTSQLLGLDATDAHALCLDDELPLRVKVCGVSVGSLLLFYYLREFKNLPLEVQFDYSNAVEVYRAITQGEVDPRRDLFVLGVAQLGGLFGGPLQEEMSCIMTMPDISFQTVATKRQSAAKDPTRGDYLCFDDELASTSFYFRDLVRERAIDERAASRTTMEPDEVFRSFRDQQLRANALLWFPHYQMNVRLNRAQLLDSSEELRCFKSNYLLCFRELGARQQLAERVLRNAWLELIESPERMQHVVASVTNDPKYRRYIGRVSGLHHLSCPELNARIANSDVTP